MSDIQHFPYWPEVLAVLSCVFLLTNDTGIGANLNEVRGLLREKFRMSEEEADAAIKAAYNQGAMEVNDE